MAKKASKGQSANEQSQSGQTTKTKATKQQSRGFSSLFVLILPVLSLILLNRYIHGKVFVPLVCNLFNIDCPTYPFSGTVDSEYEEIRELFKSSFEKGDEVGSATCIYVDGKKVVELYGGWADIEAGKVYDESTLQLVYSSGKVMTSIIVAQFVEKGLLDYNAKISTYWPEFAQGNKENVTLSDLMRHSAGVGWIDTPFDTEDLTPDKLDDFARILAAQPHGFGGHPVQSYHAFTRGWYVNEIIRRVDPKKRTVGDIVREEINPTYGVEFYYKFYENETELMARNSKIYPPSMARVLPKLFLPPWLIKNKYLGFDFDLLPELMAVSQQKDSPTYKSMHLGPPGGRDPYKLNEHAILMIEGPSFSLKSNACSMAKIAAMMAIKGQALPGTSEPPLFKDPATYDKLMHDPRTVKDAMALETLTLTQGGLGHFNEFIRTGNWHISGWGGAGGSIFMWNKENNIAVAYTMNGMGLEVKQDYRSIQLFDKMLEIVSKKKGQKADK